LHESNMTGHLCLIPVLIESGQKGNILQHKKGYLQQTHN